MAKPRPSPRLRTCPCGSTRPLTECCGPLLDGTLAPTAEALMRSRYTAYAVGHIEHLRRTWAPEARPHDLTLDAERRWLGLTVRHVEAGEAGDAEGFVEFVARSKRGGRAERMVERSRFRYVNGQWLYVSGTVPVG